SCSVEDCRMSIGCIRRYPGSGRRLSSRTGLTRDSYAPPTAIRAAFAAPRGCGSLFATPLRIDEAVSRRHWRVRAALRDRRTVEIGNLRWTEFQKELERHGQDS